MWMMKLKEQNHKQIIESLLQGKPSSLAVRLTENLQVSTDGDVGELNRTGVGSTIFMAHTGQLYCPVGEK